MNAPIVVRGIRRRMPRPDLVVAFSLQSRGVLPRLPPPRVFYVTDSLEDLPGFDSAFMRAQQRQILETAEVVVACSRGLQAQLAARGVDPVYIPHGCDAGFLEVAFDQPTPVELEGRPRPFIGFIGGLNSRIDSGLLEASIRGADGGTLILVGGKFGSHPDVDDATARLLARPDVVTTGEKSATVLPAYVAALDAAIVPYVADSFNRLSFPLKIPQYLGAGVPVVSTGNGATEELADWVSVAEDPESFEAGVRKAVASRTPERRAELRAAAARWPWTAAAQRLLDACGLGDVASAGR